MGEESDVQNDVRTDVRSDVPPSSAACKKSDKKRAKKRDKKTSNKKASAAGPPKRRGERAELAFMLKATSLGFGIAKPWGDSERYDFILDSGERLWRVQVRSTEYETHRGYSVHTYVYVKRQMVAFTAREIDVIVAYLVPLDLWYVVPVEAFSPCKNLWFYPNGSKKGSRFEIYREAWCLLAARQKDPPGDAPRNEPADGDRCNLTDVCSRIVHPNLNCPLRSRDP
jgi:hypothetical protein